MNRTGTAIAGPNNDTLYVILARSAQGTSRHRLSRLRLEACLAGDVRLRLAASSEKTGRAITDQLEWQLLAQGRSVGSAPILQSAQGAFGSVTCLARRMMKSSIFNLLAAPLLRIFHLSSRLKSTMSFGRLLSSLLRLDIRTHSLQALEYFFMLTLPFSYRNKVRAASFFGIDRAPAGASGGNFISLKKALDVVVAPIAIALSAPLMLGVALAIKLESPGPIIFRRKRIGLNGSIFEIWKFRSRRTQFG